MLLFNLSYCCDHKIWFTVDSLLFYIPRELRTFISDTPCYAWCNCIRWRQVSVVDVSSITGSHSSSRISLSAVEDGLISPVPSRKTRKIWKSSFINFSSFFEALKVDICLNFICRFALCGLAPATKRFDWSHEMVLEK